jgi:hypothetical protein
MTQKQFVEFLASADFTSLFIECGWDNPSANVQTINVPACDESFVLKEVARKNGFAIFVCQVPKIPASSVRRVIDTQLSKLAHGNFVIYVASDKELHHLWSVPVRRVDRRHLVSVEYEQPDQARFLLEKINGISFGLDQDVSIIDVINRVNATFLVNTEEVTKNFYKGFRAQHDAFVDGIQNVEDKSEREWYASVMLNRLMFCYFLQKKNFLDEDTNYLGNKLKEHQSQNKKGSFYQSFYRGFLRALFGEGLNTPGKTRGKSFLATYGRIPYLNGGMFAQHEVEARNAKIDIPDDVFDRLFAFFDQWHWHLDSRITATGRDINPDVLGYIFEQYINDRAQMGAYYTKEDITEYIGRNCIVPHLLESVRAKCPDAFAPDGPVWRLLREDPEKYVFAAVRKGAALPLPKEIERGVDPRAPKLRERRADWNRPAAEPFSLPTEIWRETVARRQRFAALRDRIAAGEVTDVADFTTFNLDIRQFAEDLVGERTDAKDAAFVRAFYDALREVTVLDPTCGSGAFLFAALNILEPLYEACLDGMETLNKQDKSLFAEELKELSGRFRNNRRYFVYKSIILRNLYGVDIMHEATEIARLRLFLKMVAVVDVDPADDNLGLEPLPDIDFNIRCGNTLVGYATEKEIDDGLVNGDMFAYVELKAKIDAEMKKASKAFETFRREQLNLQGSHDDLVKAKKEVGERLAAMRELLDAQLFAAAKGCGKKKAQWLRDTQPFHWYTEFYPVMHDRGGFDVIIGNPPYLEYSKVKGYTVCGYVTLKCANLYAYVLERAAGLVGGQSKMGMIVPISLSAAGAMQPLRKYLYAHSRDVWMSHFSNRPGQLFEGAQNRLTICLCEGGGGLRNLYSTKYHRWDAKHGERASLFTNLEYSSCNRLSLTSVCKCSGLGCSAMEKVLTNKPIAVSCANDCQHSVYWVRVPGYFCQFLDWHLRACSTSQKNWQPRGEILSVNFASAAIADVALAALNSNLFYLYFSAYTDTRHINPSDVKDFPFDCGSLTKSEMNALITASRLLKASLKKNIKLVNKSGLQIESVDSPKSKPLIDSIDGLLAGHYGLTEEELDFIVNYDVKYRMGDELAAEG